MSVVFSILQIRNQLNQEQNSKLQQQKELLNKRNMEVAVMDKRINELRERLYGKKIQACEKENISVKLLKMVHPQSVHFHCNAILLPPFAIADKHKLAINHKK